jgi:uncharacterized protein involved in exopolysaccharide biosynthesis
MFSARGTVRGSIFSTIGPALIAVYLLAASRERVASRIRNNMQAERVEREADVVKISFQSYSPLEARWMVNQAIQTYSELSTDQNRMAANAALSFLEQERNEIERKLEETEEELRSFMRSTGLVRIDSQTEKVIERISELEARRQEIRTQLVAVSSAVDTYQNQLDQIRPGLAERYAESVAPTLERYQFRLAELETERLLYITRNPALRENPELEPELEHINNQITHLKQEINRLASQMISEDDGDEFSVCAELHRGLLRRVFSSALCRRPCNICAIHGSRARRR